MSEQDVLYDVAGGVAAVTLNRPDKLNAWTARMEEQMLAAMERAAKDEGVRVVMITGAGRGFCAGADLSLLSGVAQSGVAQDRPPAEFGFGDGARADFLRKHAWPIAVPKPVIAAINGPAVGLGFVIPLFCDIRVASEAARFSTVFAKRGLTAEYGLAWMLPRLVGLGNAIDLLYSARTIDAGEALRMGLVTRVFPQEGFREAALGLAREMASSVSPRSMRVMKRQMFEAQFQTLGEALALAAEEMKASFASEDFREGVAHFLEKREPRFTGR